MKNILWLVSWYPNRTDAFSGDFIERHAKAVSRFAQLTVLLVVKDGSLKANQVETEKIIDGNLTVYKAYYGSSGRTGWIEQFLSYRKYLRVQKELYHQIEKETGRPELLHVHVAMKAGLLARWVKKIYKLPYVVTEHWTGYDPKSVPSVYHSSWVFKKLNKQVLKDCALFLPVTDNLGKTVHENFVPVRYQVVPNVADTRFFFYHPYSLEKFRFIHPSYMNYQKNPEGILAACALLKKKGYDFELLMIGHKEERLMQLAAGSGLLNSSVFFEAAVPYEEVARQMQRSSALLLFSRFENLPCVVLEALCCGLPVISSRVGGINEVVNDDNGLLVESEHIEQLAAAMGHLINTYSAYQRDKIAAKAMAQFNYDVVGRQYLSVYQNILQR